MRDGDWRHHSAASAHFADSNYARADLVRLEEIGQRHFSQAHDLHGLNLLRAAYPGVATGSEKKKHLVLASSAYVDDIKAGIGPWNASHAV
jgi:hypothetical protein